MKKTRDSSHEVVGEIDLWCVRETKEGRDFEGSLWSSKSDSAEMKRKMEGETGLLHTAI